VKGARPETDGGRSRPPAAETPAPAGRGVRRRPRGRAGDGVENPDQGRASPPGSASQNATAHTTSVVAASASSTKALKTRLPGRSRRARCAATRVPAARPRGGRARARSRGGLRLIGLGTVDVRPQVMTRDAGQPLDLKDAFGGHPPPLPDCLRADPKRTSGGAWAAEFRNGCGSRLVDLSAHRADESTTCGSSQVRLSWTRPSRESMPFT